MKKKLAVFIYSTHDRLFASVVTALSFHNHHKNDDYDLYLIIDYDSKFDEFSAPDSRLNDYAPCPALHPSDGRFALSPVPADCEGTGRDYQSARLRHQGLPGR